MYGIVNLCKPVGPTSRDCVNQVAKGLKQPKVAHAGTLDPLAQGVLVLLIGPAVRLMDEMHQLDKEYVARFRFGHCSPSGDLETPCEVVGIPPGIVESDIQRATARFLGRIDQTPPAYSAIRVDGKRAYAAARRGATVQIPQRRVMVHDLELLRCELPEIDLRIRCSTGTYIRTLGSDLAKSLGTDAVMTELTRVRVGPFRIDASHPMNPLSGPIPDAWIQPPESGLTYHPQWRVDDSMMRRILDGQRLAAEEVVPSASERLAVLDTRSVLRAIIKRLPDGCWRCEKGIAHWDIYP